jgi:hypothetical protein
LELFFRFEFQTKNQWRAQDGQDNFQVG